MLDAVVGNVRFGPEASPVSVDLHARQTSFFNTMLKGTPLVDQAPGQRL
jgi:hypothetical protein